MNDNTENEHHEHHIAQLIDPLNNETGKLSWKELERHFARGAVIKVAVALDLVNVASTFAQDNKAQVESWAIVTVPWVLVQEISEQ